MYRYHYEIYNEYEPATSLWESWNVDTQQCITCETSRDHHYQASINTFLRKYVAGLDMQPGTSGWSALRVRPYYHAGTATVKPARTSNGAAADSHSHIHSPSPLLSAAASVASHRGMVHVAWMRDSATDTVALNVTVPPGSIAEVHVPLTRHMAAVTESGQC